MLLLLAFSAVAAQPLAGRLYGPAGPAFGTPNAYPNAYAPAPRRSWIPSQDQFDMYVANQEVRSDERARQGNYYVYNLLPAQILPGIATTPIENQKNFLRFGAAAKAGANYMNEQLIQDKIDYFYATHPGPLSLEDRNTLDDLELEREAARGQKNRRATSAMANAFFPNGAFYSDWFDRQSHEAGLELAQNRLVDARQDFQEDPSQQNRIDVINARETAEQMRDKRDANSFDLMGFSKPYTSVIGPALRKRASGTQIEIGERNLRVARDAYAKDPSQDNYYQVRLAKLFLEASIDDDDANSKDLLRNAVTVKYAGSMTPTTAQHLNLYSTILMNKNLDYQSRKWLRYSKLKRQILRRKLQAKRQGSSSSSAASTAAAAAPEGSVAQRMLAMNNYGPRPAAVAPRVLPPNAVY